MTRVCWCFFNLKVPDLWQFAGALSAPHGFCTTWVLWDNDHFQGKGCKSSFFSIMESTHLHGSYLYLRLPSQLTPLQMT